MSYEAKLGKNFSPIEQRTLGLAILAGLLLLLTHLSPTTFYSFPFSNVSLRSSSMNTSLTSKMGNDSIISSPKFGIQNATHKSTSHITHEHGKEDANRTQFLLGKLTESKDGNLTIEKSNNIDQLKINSDVIVLNNSSIATTHINSIQEQVTYNSEQFSGNNTELNEGGIIVDVLKLDLSESDVNASHSIKTASSARENFTVSLQKEITINSTVESDAKRKDAKPKETKPLCDFSNRRSNICDMHGDIRIHGKSSSIVSMITSSQKNESYQIRPYARKTDFSAMSGVTELNIKSSYSFENAPQCFINHNVPAVVFSVSGYTGNFFHDFTDILIPLFLTSYQFNGEVQFVATNFRFWWIHKYLPIMKSLSKYELIDIDKDDRVHCFKHAIVGLKSDDDLKIDTSKSPNGLSMVDFTKFMRKAYSLPRESPLMIKKNSGKKPRLLIVARSRTRRFMNLKSIVKMAKKSGYEVIVGEAETNVTHFAQIVNTCDVMMGVHGAGLTNFVFLPTNAILIQIVPWGKLDWIARTYFDEPSKGMNLRYLEYKISVDESTLIDLYPRNDPVLRDPLTSVHKFGWDSVKEMYLVKQNVKLNVRRFKPVLMKALKLLHEQ